MLQPCIPRLLDASSQIESKLLANVRHTLTQIKQPHSADEMFVKSSAILMLMNSRDGDPEDINFSQVARYLGVDRRTLSQAKLRLSSENEDRFPIFMCRRGWNTGRLTEVMKDVIVSFWITRTQVSPNKKDICNMRIGTGTYVQHPFHLLDESQVYFHCIQSVST